jgi:transcriptional regulator with XRE-family HTH domain
MPPAVAARLDTIRERGGIRQREVAQLLDTTPETVSRWQTGRVEPASDRLQRILTLEWLISQLGDFYEPAEARLWLFSPHRLLGGERPADRIQQGKLDDVLAVIAQLRDGAYA